MEEQFRPKEKVGGSTPSEGTKKRKYILDNDKANRKLPEFTNLKPLIKKFTVDMTWWGG